MALPPRVNDLRGQVFGLLAVLEYVGPIGNCRHAYWKVQCSCEKKKIFDVVGTSLTRGMTKSCGCLVAAVGRANKTHGMHGTSEYEAWHGGQQRCTNPNHPAYADYGGRGITWPKEWLHNFDQFFKDMGLKADPKHTLERVLNHLGYSAANCVWAPRKAQNRNKRSSRFLELNGKKLTVAGWAEETGIPAKTIIKRLDVLGWSVEQALTTPARVWIKKSQPGEELGSEIDNNLI